MKIRNWLIPLLVTAALADGHPQQQQNPPAAEQRTAPRGPNGAKVGPPLNEAAPAQQREGQPTQANAPNAAAMQEAVRNFLAIGAPPNPEAAKRGQAIFVPTCGFCHGTNATGGASGPNLVRSTVVLHDQGTGKDIGPVIHNGRPGKGMPAFPNFTDAQIHDIAQFLLGRTQAAANRMEYTIQNIVTGDPKAGEAYFQAHCTDCHSPAGDLAHIAQKYEPVALQGRFLYPQNSNPFELGPPPDPRTLKHVTVTLPSGQTYSGVLVRVDDFSVALREDSGVYRSWVYNDAAGIRVDVHDPLAQHLKLLHQYTDADMHNILAYLETLK
ncbi:MAG TPA: c-type cytochrome [Bryobacteraceae bacterium]|jgi:mono/diheme cytochrome c family protein|nr:c-type cytochrome [Bryobacteraceae bacterium]